MRACFILPNVMGGCFVNCSNICHSIIAAGGDALLIITHSEDWIGIDPELLKGIKHVVIRYRRNDSKYHLFQKLKRQITDFDADTIVLNDLVDYQLVRTEQLSQQVIAILHGDYNYYYELAINSAPRIDKFVCVSELMKQKLVELLPERKEDIVYIPPMTRDFFIDRQTGSEDLSVLFVGRMTEEKGFQLLPKIDNALADDGYSVKWTVIARRITSEFDTWISKPNVHHREVVDNADMLEVYKKNDLLLLPSTEEGTPLALLEAMKAGVVPLVSDLPTISTNILMDGTTGYRLPINDAIAYVSKIEKLYKNRSYLNEMSQNAAAKSSALFSVKAVSAVWQSILHDDKSKKDTSAVVASAYDRLDKAWLPNSIVSWLRKVRQKNNERI
ncbi:MAG: glycosyltransferase family 4 protein [Flavipsychrobacter sp.]